jgi:tRNA-dihydrouridine synthase B
MTTPLDRLSPNRMMLAPMVGLTHYAVRKGVQSFLPADSLALWPTEMLNSRRIPSEQVNQFPETYFYDYEAGLCPQLLANEEEFIARSVPRLEMWGAQAIDINMGCPVRKALKHNYGVALMGDPDYAAEIVKIATHYATVPVSVKLRAGSEKNDFDYLVKFIGGLYEAGASWITIHPRFAEQKRRGEANWHIIRQLKDIFKKPIIGNGDIQCFEDAKQMFEETGADRLMVGRAMTVKPWLIRYEEEPDVYTQGEWYGQFLKTVLNECREYYSEKDGRRRILFLLQTGKPWVEFGEYLQGRMQSAQNYEEMAAALDKFFSQKQKIIKRTELRS